MRDLFLAECRRFLRPVLICLIVHLALQLVLGHIMDMLAVPDILQYMAMAVCCLAALGLALYQLGTHTQPGRWVWLMHRPLSPAAIFGALALSAGAAILVAIGLPLLLTVLASDVFTARTVDLRHYVGVGFIVALSMTAWLIGAAVMLSRSYVSALLLFLPAMLAPYPAEAWRLLLAELGCAALLAYIVYGYFRPNRLAAPEDVAANLARAVPVTIGCYYLLLGSCVMLFQIPMLMLGTQPAKMEVPLAGSYMEARRMESAAMLAKGLAASRDPRAALWLSRPGDLSPLKLRPFFNAYPLPQQLSNRLLPQFSTANNHVQWTFNHGAMLFQGIDRQTGAARGWFGVHGAGDATPFPSIPVFGERGYLTSARHAYEVGVDQDNPVAGRPILRVALPAGEQFAWPPRHWGRLEYALTDKRVIAYRPDPAVPDAPFQQVFSVPYPGPFADLERVDVAAVPGGTLVSITGGHEMWNGQPGGSQTLLYVDAQGRSTLLAQRPLEHDYPALYEHAQWWISPVLNQLTELPALLFSPTSTQTMMALLPMSTQRPPAVLAAALLGSALAVLGAWLRLRRNGPLTRGAMSWLAACAVFGLPALACMLALASRPAARAAARQHTALPLAA